jgi:hypothetical protein
MLHFCFTGALSPDMIQSQGKSLFIITQFSATDWAAAKVRARLKAKLRMAGGGWTWIITKQWERE